jgi:cytochrome P450 family 9
MGLILYLIPVALYLFYKWATTNYDYFSKQGIPFNKPWPLLGSDIGLMLKKLPFEESFMVNYNLYKNEK